MVTLSARLIATHRFPVARVKDAFELVLRKDRSAIGIVLDWTNEA
ncbi:MAG: hypothetical protein ACRDIC_05205 [bacterium]